MDIAGLPEELYQHLFEFLSLTDLINLRLVCKVFDKRVKAYVIKDVNFCPNNHEQGWFFKIPNCTFKNSLYSSQIVLLERQVLNFRHLKCLRLSSFKVAIKPIDLKAIFDKLVHLEHLEIGVFPATAKENEKLVFPKLKKLYLRDYPSGSLEIEAPNLRDFHLDEAKMDKSRVMTFTQPASIECLGIKNFDLLPLYFGDFKGVEHLRIFEAFNMDAICLLDNYPSLKSVTILRCRAQNLEELVKLKQFQQRCQFKVYFRGFEIRNRNDLTALGEASFETDSIPKGHSLGLADVEMFENYETLAPDLSWVRGIRYRYLMKHFNGATVPETFFEMFNHLWKVVTYSKVDQNQFIKFLARCQSLRELEMRDGEVSQSFLNELPSVTSLYCFGFYAKDRNQSFDFCFLNRMYELEQFSTNLNIIKHEGLRLNRQRIRSIAYDHRFEIIFDIFDGKNKAFFTVRKDEKQKTLGLMIWSNMLGFLFKRKCPEWIEANLPIKAIDYEELVRWQNYWQKKNCRKETIAKIKSFFGF